MFSKLDERRLNHQSSHPQCLSLLPLLLIFLLGAFLPFSLGLSRDGSLTKLSAFNTPSSSPTLPQKLSPAQRGTPNADPGRTLALLFWMWSRGTTPFPHRSGGSILGGLVFWQDLDSSATSWGFLWHGWVLGKNVQSPALALFLLSPWRGLYVEQSFLLLPQLFSAFLCFRLFSPLHTLIFSYVLRFLCISGVLNCCWVVEKVQLVTTRWNDMAGKERRNEDERGPTWGREEEWDPGGDEG